MCLNVNLNSGVLYGRGTIEGDKNVQVDSAWDLGKRAFEVVTRSINKND